jgi:hypothetical protein
VAGKYQGTTETPEGPVPLTCELTVNGSALNGIFTAGVYSVTITGGSLAGETLTLNGDVNGMAISMTAAKKGTGFQGSWTTDSASGLFAIERVSEGSAAAAKPSAAPEAKPTGGKPADQPAPAAGGDPISGDWDGLVDTPDQQRPITLKLKLEGEKVTGEIGSEMGTVALQSGSYSGGNLSIAFPFQTGDMITMTAVLQEGKLVGQLSLGGQMTVAWVAVRKK